MSGEKVRESVIAGTWYPGNPERLRQEVKGYLKRAKSVKIPGKLVALIAPHAGYTYSGAVAAHAYRVLEGRGVNRVVILAPSHRAYFQGASVYHLGGYRTPLGVVPLDRELVEEVLASGDPFSFVPQAHAQEHALEIQLPFLQVVLGEFSLVPIVMGDQDMETCRRVADALSQCCRGKDVILVASSDLSHYHPYKEALRLDRQVMDMVERFNPEGLHEALKQGRCEACGGGPIVATMLTAKALGADMAKVVHYANSGDVTGDTSGVVGYMAAVLYQDSDGSACVGRAKERQQGCGDAGLEEEEKEMLRRLAREAIRARLEGRNLPALESRSERLEQHRGAFVTLHKKGSLRGCIGYVEGGRPLWETVRDAALHAAFSDPRFPPVAPDELEELELEISVLSPLKRIDDPSTVCVGTHGILLRKGGASGLLLPQVAVEHGLDRKTFLEWTCRKAGLPPNAWKGPDTEIYVFSADVF